MNYKSQHSSNNKYSRVNARYQTKRSKAPIIILVIILIAVLTVCMVLFYNCSKQNNSVESSTQGLTETNSIIITLHGDEQTKVLKGEDYIEAGAHAVDKNEGNITQNLEINGNVNINQPGTYTISYIAKNSKNEYHKRDRKVEVVDSFEKAEPTNGIPVMMYHWVYQDNNPPANLNSNYISTSNLESHLKWLSEHKFYYPSYQELRAFIDGKHSLPKNSAILTFDDGEIGFLTYGKSLFEKYKIPVTSFIVCNAEGYDKHIINFASEYIDFQSHTYGMHGSGTSGKGHGGKIFDLNKKEVVQDLKKASEFLGTNEALAYPFGDVSDEGAEAVKEVGILCAFTVEPGFCKQGMDFTRLPRVRILGTTDLSGFVANFQ